MSTRPPAPWQEVKDALTGPRVAAEIGLPRARERHKYGCPACDSSDALHVYADGAKCYACDWSGSVIDMAAAAWNVEPAEACQRLAERFGIGPDPLLRPPPPPTQKKPRSPDPDVLRLRAEVLGGIVSDTTLGAGARRYVDGRGLSPDLAEIHGLRSCESPGEWGDAWAALEKQHGPDAMTTVGLRRDGRPWYPWGGRVPAIAIPYLSRTGQVEALRWRRIDGGADFRYMTPIGGGARIPWGAEAVDGPLPLLLVIVEGELDALALRQAGYDALGLGGATPSRELIAWAVEHVGHVDRLALWTDPDAAGAAAVDRLGRELVTRYGAAWATAHVTRWHAGADPADTLQGATQ